MYHRPPQIHYDDFIPLFETQYPRYPWSDVQVPVVTTHHSFHLSLFSLSLIIPFLSLSVLQDSIFTAFKELFTSACSAEPPAGIAHSVQVSKPSSSTSVLAYVRANVQLGRG